jgi:hypothetical protein
MKKSILFSIFSLFILWNVFPQENVFKTPPRAEIRISHYYQVTSELSEFRSTRTSEISCFPSNRKFSPPSAGLEPKFTSVTVHSEKSNCVVFPEGYTVKIARGSLINAKGEAVNGDLQLHLRDLTSVYSLVFSGVPMAYDTAGTSELLMTAGMFELYAEQNGEELFLRPGYTIDIELPSPDGSPGYNLYYFNEENSSWEFSEPLPPSTAQNSREPEFVIYSDAYQLLPLYYRGNYDTTTYYNRWLSEDYARAIPFNRAVFQGKRQTHSKYVIANVPYFRIQRENYPEFREKTLFRLPQKPKAEQKDFARQFRHLLPIRATLWEYTGSLTKKEFYQQYIKGKRYIDVRIEYIEGNNDFLITLKHIDGTEEISARPFRRTEFDEDKMVSLHKKTAGRIIRVENRAQNQFNKSQNKKQYLKQLYLDEIRELMSEEELAMTWSEWIEYANSSWDYVSRMLNVPEYSIAIRNITATGFGLINIDKIRFIPNRRDLIATFLLPDNSEISFGHAIVMYGSGNSVLSFPIISKKTQLIVSGTDLQAICVISSDNEVYVVNASDVSKAVSSGKNYTFRLQKNNVPVMEAIAFALIS